MIEGKGSYVLLLRLERTTNITVGRLGQFVFPKGYYLYAGSARNGLWGRIKRHLRRDKLLHWHIDYLTSTAKLLEVWYRIGDEKVECVWAEAATNLSNAVQPAAGFGSSDCRCYSHLIFFRRRPILKVFGDALANMC
jgi:Uri superfamily endonuclease